MWPFSLHGMPGYGSHTEINKDGEKRCKKFSPVKRSSFVLVSSFHVLGRVRCEDYLPKDNDLDKSPAGIIRSHS